MMAVAVVVKAVFIPLIIIHSPSPATDVFKIVPAPTNARINEIIVPKTPVKIKILLTKD